MLRIGFLAPAKGGLEMTYDTISCWEGRGRGWESNG